MGKSPTELDPKNAVETHSDLFVLCSALEDCHQGTHLGLYLGGNMVVHHPVGCKIPHFLSVRMAGKTDVRDMFRYTWTISVP